MFVNYLHVTISLFNSAYCDTLVISNQETCSSLKLLYPDQQWGGNRRYFTNELWKLIFNFKYLLGSM